MRMTILLTMVIIAIFLSLPTVNAIYVKETCLNDTHIQTEFDFDLEIEGITTDYIYIQVHNCTHGCFNDKCRGTSTEGATYMSILIPFVLFFASLLIIGLSLRDQHKILQPLFVFGALWIVVLMFGVVESMIEESGVGKEIQDQVSTGLNIANIVIYVLMAYFLVMFIWSALEWWRLKEKVKKDKLELVG